MLVEIFHPPAQALLPLALPVLPALAQLGQQWLGGFVLAQTGAFLMAEHVDQGIGDVFQGLAVAAEFEGLKVFQGRIQRFAPVRGQLPEAAQQIQVLFKGGVDRIEAAHDLEVLAQGCLPVGTVVVAADLVDQRKAGPAGPAQDIHFRFVFAVIGH